MARITDWAGISKWIDRGVHRGYRVRVHVRPLPVASKTFPHGTPHDELVTWRDDKKRELEGKRPEKAAADGFAADVTRYLEQWNDGTKHAKTVEQRTLYLRHWADVFGDRPRHSISTFEIEKQLRAWKKRGLPQSARARRRDRVGKAISDESVRKIRQAIYQLYEVLDRGTARKNPVADVPAGTAPPPDPRGLPQDVVRAVLAHLPRGRVKACSYVVAYLGLRPPCEVAALEPGDWNASYVFVRSAKGSDRTTLPLTRRGQAALRYFRQLKAWGACTSTHWNRELQKAARATLADPTTPAAIAAALRTALETGPGRPGLTAYSLRHSYGTWHYQTTGDIQATQAAMRHKTLAMTQRYTRAGVDATLARSIAQLDDAFRTRRI